MSDNISDEDINVALGGYHSFLYNLLKQVSPVIDEHSSQSLDDMIVSQLETPLYQSLEGMERHRFLLLLIELKHYFDQHNVETPRLLRWIQNKGYLLSQQ